MRHETIPKVTLTNGLRVANFSSAHPFEFEDGSILPAVSKETSMRLAVPKTMVQVAPNTVTMSFPIHTSDFLRDQINGCMKNKNIDIFICPLMMLQGIKEEWGQKELINSPFRSIVRERNGVCSISKFSIP